MKPFIKKILQTLPLVVLVTIALIQPFTVLADAISDQAAKDANLYKGAGNSNSEKNSSIPGINTNCTTPRLSDCYKFLAPISDESSKTLVPTNLPTYLGAMFKIIISLCGVIAVFMIVYGGILYMSTDAIQGKHEGKEIIQRTLWGILLIMASFLILATINGNFGNTNGVASGINDLNKNTVVPTSGDPGGGFGNSNLGSTLADSRTPQTGTDVAPTDPCKIYGGLGNYSTDGAGSGSGSIGKPTKPGSGIPPVVTVLNPGSPTQSSSAPGKNLTGVGVVDDFLQSGSDAALCDPNYSDTIYTPQASKGITFKLDGKGLSIIETPPDAQIIYVSSINGAHGNSGDANSPIADLNEALGMLRDGHPDQIFIEKGSHFTDPINLDIKGASTSEPIVISTYGTGDKPLIDVSGKSNPTGIKLGGSRYVLITGFHIVGPVGSGTAIDPGSSKNISIEDSDFDHFKTDYTQDTDLNNLINFAGDSVVFP